MKLPVSDFKESTKLEPNELHCNSKKHHKLVSNPCFPKRAWINLVLCMLFAQGNDGGLYLRDQRDPLNMAIMSGSVLYRISSYMAFMYKTHPFSLLTKKKILQHMKSNFIA